MPEAENVPKNYGIALSDLSTDVMKKVVEIYEETVGKTGGTEQYKEQLAFGIDREISDLKDRRFTDLRLGSKLTVHSKLTIKPSRTKPDAVYFSFNPNLNPQEKKGNANEMMKRFNSKINDYLHGSGIGVEL